MARKATALAEVTTLEVIETVSNGGEIFIEESCPYTATITIEGVCPILFHRWNSEAVDAKAKAAKNSAAKKTDDLNSFVYIDEDGFICLPGEYLRRAIVMAAKFKQDPRSPRKSAMDLFNAGVVSLTELASLGAKKWDYVDQRRVVIQRNAITRSRPAMRAGWTAEIDLMINLPEYISPAMLNEVVQSAGRLVGVGDFRPTYGRFLVNGFSVHQE